MDRRRLSPCLLLSLLLGLLPGLTPGDARADAEGYEAAAYLLSQTTKPYRDGRQNTMLRSLRQLRDPNLQALYVALTNSAYAPQRVHGLLGLGEISADRRLDLAALAEIENERERIETLSAALDDELIDKSGMATLMSWNGLALPVKQAIALRLLSEGGQVDPAPFRVSVEVELTDELGAAQLLQYALGGLLLAELGEASGERALAQLSRYEGDQSDTVLAQVFDGAMRREIKSGGPLALAVANDPDRAVTLRLLAMQTALRLQTDGARAVWQLMYNREDSAARRVRLALIALDNADRLDGSAFDVLAENDQELIRLIAGAGRAIATSGDAPGAFAPLLATGQPLATAWVTTYVRRQVPTDGAALLELVIRNQHAGDERNRPRLAEAAIAATQALCELYPDQANRRLPALLDAAAQPGEPDDDGRELTELQTRQTVLLGIARAQKVDLKPLAAAINSDGHDDFTTKALRLLIRARHGAPLTNAEWSDISDMVQGVGGIDLGLRIQLAWRYLEHLGKGKQAIAQALR